MRSLKACIVLISALAVLAPWSSASGSLSTVTVYLPGYSYAPFVTLLGFSSSDIELDAAGNLYLCGSRDIRRITPEGAMSPWSSAPATDLTLLNSGDGSGAGRALCDCIVSLSADGSYSTLHADSYEWTYTKLGPDGTLYATVWVGDGRGLYSIDRVTGTPAILVNGGPGPGGDGLYADMVIGLDEKLYTCGSTDGSLAGWGLFRLDGGQFTMVAPLPHGGFGLAQDNQGLFYTAVSAERFDGSIDHEVWLIDPSAGTSSVLADGPHGASSVAYDRARDCLYVPDTAGNVYVITKSSVAVHRDSWGATKARYR